MANGKIYIGRRKCAKANVILRTGENKITVNKKDAKEYFLNNEYFLKIIHQPIDVTGYTNYEINVNVKGGGLSGQAGAIRLGIARALLKLDEKYHKPLKSNGYLTRDPRMVERKKYGKAGARRSFQFSKR